MMMLIMWSDERITESKHRDGHRDKKTIISFMCWLLLQPLIGVFHASTAMARPRHQWRFSTLVYWLVLTVKTRPTTPDTPIFLLVRPCLYGGGSF